jgi:hypothetical protein
MKAPQAFDPAEVPAAQAAGKQVWIYHAIQPHVGTLATDAEAVAPRVNGWIAAMFDVGRWFWWQTEYWNDFQNGRGQLDVFVEPRTFGGF